MALSSMLPAPAAPQPRPAWQPGAPAPADALQAQPLEGESAAAPWKLILGLGGGCWIVLALLASLPGAPAPLAAPSLWDSLTQQLLVFLAAASGYRATLALSWPESLAARLRVVALALLIAFAVVGLVPQLAEGLIGLLRERAAQPASFWGQAAGAARLSAQVQRFLPPYLLGLCASALALSARGSAQARRQAAALAGECAGAHMRMLSAQLQPHFLFNALHAISVLVEDSPRRASAMIARLGDFLRHALESGRWPWTDLASELAGVEAYLAVQKMRFADGLTVAVEAAPEALGACVPALLLQPLVENAIEHGRSAGGAVVHVRIAACVVASRLCIVVSNSPSRLRADLTPADFGHGLGNVEQRLRAAYGEEGRLTVGPHGTDGTAAFVELPRRTFSPARSAPRERP
jgi:two-component system LytT family sensor kinase